MADAGFKPRILLVDDEPRFLTSLIHLLTPHGMVLTSADTGTAAIRALNAQAFDLVILDLNLPDIDGHAVMDFINQCGYKTQVVVASGDTDIAAAIGALKRGAYDYLRKPYTPEELLHTVDKALSARRLLEENQRMARELEASEQKFRQLVNHSPDIIFSLDPNGHIGYVNRRLQTALGRSPDSVQGKSIQALVHPEDVKAVNHSLVLACNERRSRSVEVRLFSAHGNGEWRHFWVEFSPVGDNDAEPGASAGHWNVHTVARDITERKRAEELITYQAYHDILTDLPNRVLLRDRLGLALLQTKRNGGQLTVMFIDLDGFKAVNDMLGHSNGDKLLQQVTARLRGCLRAGDTLARIGGDEFMAVVPDMGGRGGASQIARKFLDVLQTPFDLAGQAVHISASIGIAIYPDNGATIDELIKNADIAMYQIKVDGKNGFSFFDESMLESSGETAAFETSVRAALDNDELEMHYQPQIDVSDNRVVGVEALMRWQHPQRGLINAGEFLPMCEINGLIFPLTDWMVERVCRDVQAWQARGLGDIRVALNLSPKCLDRGNFHELMERSLSQHGLPAACFEVEVTENLCIQDPEMAVDQLTNLSQIGVSVAIDDFGTGYSSLSYLHRFPVHTIKIDRAFVTEIQEGARPHWPVVLAIIAIARGLNLNMVAEGVETDLQAKYLTDAGCKVMQGYLFAKPMASDDLVEFLESQI